MRNHICGDFIKYAEKIEQNKVVIDVQLPAPGTKRNWIIISLFLPLILLCTFVRNYLVMIEKTEKIL